MTVNADDVSRTAKILIDSAESETIAEAEARLDSWILQVRVGPMFGNRCRQAALLTIVNAAVRAFRGGVRVFLDDDPLLDVGWYGGQCVSAAIVALGAELVDEHTGQHPTVVVGDVAAEPLGSPVLYATFDGWAAGVVERRDDRLAERDVFVPAGVAAGGIAVAEAFEAKRGTRPWAGRRATGLSLWRPDASWRSLDGLGPDDVTFAPSKFWLVGLGHLGQGYAWNIGMLPFATPADVALLLQDDDIISKSNHSTGLLTDVAHVGQRKTRVIADQLQRRGFRTTITERRLTGGCGPTGDEPRLALIGVDNRATRYTLSEHDFDIVIDVGLGGGPDHYLDIQLRTFPGDRDSHDVPAWQQDPASDTSVLAAPAYQQIADAGDSCGAIEIAGRTVAASFVGATAGALAIAEATRALMGELRHVIVDCTLRNLDRVGAVVAGADMGFVNTGSAPLR